MENRERDRVSQRTTPTDAGQLNRHVEEEKGRQHHSGTTAEFGQNIGESEFPSKEGGNLNMHNRNKKDDMSNDRSMGNESSRRSGSENWGSSSGRSSGSSNEIGSSDSSSTNRRGSTGELGSTGSSEGRH